MRVAAALGTTALEYRDRQRFIGRTTKVQDLYFHNINYNLLVYLRAEYGAPCGPQPG